MAGPDDPLHRSCVTPCSTQSRFRVAGRVTINCSRSNTHVRSSDRHRQVVQRRQGLRLHHARRAARTCSYTSVPSRAPASSRCRKARRSRSRSCRARRACRPTKCRRSNAAPRQRYTKPRVARPGVFSCLIVGAQAAGVGCRCRRHAALVNLSCIRETGLPGIADESPADLRPAAGARRLPPRGRRPADARRAAPPTSAPTPAAPSAPVELKDVIETDPRYVIGISYPPGHRPATRASRRSCSVTPMPRARELMQAVEAIRQREAAVALRPVAELHHARRHPAAWSPSPPTAAATPAARTAIR